MTLPHALTFCLIVFLASMSVIGYMSKRISLDYPTTHAYNR